MAGLVLGVVGLLAASAAGQEHPGVPYRPADLALGPAWAPQHLWTDHGLFASLGGRCVFVAEGTWGIGRELWVTDGTAAGTRLLKDLDARAGRDLALSAVEEFVDGGVRKAAFLGSNEVGSVVVETDGTPEGTVVSEPSSPPARRFVGSLGGRPLFIAGATLEQGWTLWIAEGPRARPLGRWARVNPGRLSPVGEVGGRSYWLQSAPDGVALFCTDGTPEGTGRVDAIPASTAAFVTATTAAGRVFMITYLASGETAAYVTGGTPETTAPIAMPPGVNLSPTSILIPLPDRSGVILGATNTLVRTDGTAAGTAVLRTGLSLETGSDGLPAVIATDQGPVTLFGAVASGGQRGLWATDGTPGGTTLLTSNGASWNLLGAGDGRAWLTLPPIPNEVWVTDGTPAGTRRASIDRLKDTSNGNTGLLNGPFSAAAGDRLVLAPRLASQPWDQQGDLLVFEGASGTRTLLDPGPGAPLELGPGVGAPVVLGDRTIFAVSDPSAATSRLLISDGTAAGTAPLVDATFPTLSPLTRVGSLVWFAFTNSAGLKEVWRTDGTAVGTFAVGAPPAGPSEALGPVLAGGDGVVFQTDGVYTASGAAGSVRRLSGPAATRTGDLGVDSRGRVYYARVSAGLRILMVDPAAGVETELAVIPVSQAAYPLAFAAVGDLVYFNEPSNTRRLWRTDGTRAGTIDLSATAPRDGSPRAAAGDRLLLSRAAGTGVELLAVEPSGAVATVREFNAILAMTSFAGRVVLLADDGLHGVEPWTSDGTPEGTVMITETVPGARGAVFGSMGEVLVGRSPQRPTLVAGDRAVYFSVAEDDLAAHAWRTDGTAAGTRPLMARPDELGRLPLAPSDFTESAGAVWLRGWTPDRGVDLYAVRTCDADFNTDGFLDFFDYGGCADAFTAGTPDADFNGDGFVDFFDYGGFVDAFERGC